MLRPLEPQITVVQFDQPLTDPELKRVGRFMADYPDVRLRMYGYHNRTDPDHHTHLTALSPRHGDRSGQT